MHARLTVYIVADLHGRGGLERQTTLLAVALAKLGHRVFFFTPHATSPDNPHFSYLRQHRVPCLQPPYWLDKLLSDPYFHYSAATKVALLLMPSLFPIVLLDSLLRKRPIRRSWNGAFGKLRSLFTSCLHEDRTFYSVLLQMLILRLAYRPDVVHIHGYHFPYGNLLVWLKRLGWRVVYTERSCPDPSTAPISPVQLLANADLVIAVSEATKQAISSIWNFSGTINYIPQHIVDDPYPHGVLPDHSYTSCANTVCCISRLSPEKGLRYLISAAQRVISLLPETRFLVAGTGHSPDKLWHEVARLSLERNFCFLGWLSHDAVQQLIRISDVIVQPSLSEALGATIIEAMAHGKAIVVTNVGGLSNLIENEVTGIVVPPADSLLLSSAIIRLLLRHDLRKALGLNARKKYETGLYSERDVAMATTRAYLSLY